MAVRGPSSVSGPAMSSEAKTQFYRAIIASAVLLHLMLSLAARTLLLTWEYRLVQCHVDRLIGPDNAEVASSILATPTIVVPQVVGCTFSGTGMDPVTVFDRVLITSIAFSDAAAQTTELLLGA